MDSVNPEKTSVDEQLTDSDDRRPQFGNRSLTDPQNVFEHNAWDNVVWDEEQEAEARQVTQKQSESLVDSDLQEKYEKEADGFWNSFYGQHQNRFFKDRHWLFTEFPELSPDGCHGNTKDTSVHLADTAVNKMPDTNSSSLSDYNCDTIAECDRAESQECGGGRDDETFPGEKSKFRILEVGCGVGNTVFPILQTNNDPALMVYCCDFSSTAVQIVKEQPDYDARRCHAFVYDVTSDSPFPFPECSLDVIILIFVLSAVNPDKMQFAVTRLAKHLKPGGIILLRDYGRYDMAQLRFKKGRCLSENFYVRGDGTRVYFFTQDELRTLFSTAGLVEVQNLVDRRLQVNRGRQLKMYRVWIQCKYQKPTGEVTPDEGLTLPEAEDLTLPEAEDKTGR